MTLAPGSFPRGAALLQLSLAIVRLSNEGQIVVLTDVWNEDKNESMDVDGSLVSVRTLFTSLFSLLIFSFGEVPPRRLLFYLFPHYLEKRGREKISFSVFCDGVSMAPDFSVGMHVQVARNNLTIPLWICCFYILSEDPAETLQVTPLKVPEEKPHHANASTS